MHLSFSRLPANVRLQETPSQYQAKWPQDVLTYPGLSLFLEKFYKLSDDSSLSAEMYADNFTDNATLIIGKKKAVGRAGTDRSIHLAHFYQN
jgi:hypothetical protein